MEEALDFFDPAELVKLAGLNLRARRIVEGYVAGAHRSPYHGFSVEFAEHREYSPGDDLRRLDWKAFGRTDKFYLKRFEDETNLACHLAVDVSESMTYKGPDASMSKLEYAQCLAASLAWIVLQQQDAVSLTTFDNEVRAWLQPSGRPDLMQQIYHALQTNIGGQRTSIGPILHELAGRTKKRGVIFILSDMFDDPVALAHGLKHLRHRRHDVTVLHLLDPAELDFPFERPTIFHGMERADDLAIDPRTLRRAYLREINGFCHELEEICHQLEIEYQQIKTDYPFDEALTRILLRN